MHKIISTTTVVPLQQHLRQLQQRLRKQHQLLQKKHQQDLLQQRRLQDLLNLEVLLQERNVINTLAVWRQETQNGTPNPPPPPTEHQGKRRRKEPNLKTPPETP